MFVVSDAAADSGARCMRSANKSSSGAETKLTQRHVELLRAAFYVGPDGRELSRRAVPPSSAGTPMPYGKNPRALACLAAASKCRNEALTWPPPADTTPLNDAASSKEARRAYASRFVPSCSLQAQRATTPRGTAPPAPQYGVSSGGRRAPAGSRGRKVLARKDAHKVDRFARPRTPRRFLPACPPFLALGRRKSVERRPTAPCSQRPTRRLALGRPCRVSVLVLGVITTCRMTSSCAHCAAAEAAEEVRDVVGNEPRLLGRNCEGASSQ